MKQRPFRRILGHIQNFGLAGLNLYCEMWSFKLNLEHHKPDLKARIPISIGNTTESVLQNGETLFTARHEGQIVSWLKRSENPYPLTYIDQHLQLAPKECYLHGAFTQPAYRSQGLLVELISQACKSAHHTSALVAIISYNQSSIRPLLKLASDSNKSEASSALAHGGVTFPFSQRQQKIPGPQVSRCLLK